MNVASSARTLSPGRPRQAVDTHLLARGAPLAWLPLRATASFRHGQEAAGALIPGLHDLPQGRRLSDSKVLGKQGLSLQPPRPPAQPSGPY